MEGDEKQAMGTSHDHDLLIRLDVRFGDFEKNQRSAQESMNDKLILLLSKMDKKVDKEDIAELERQMNGRFVKVDERLRALEERNHAKDVEKDTVIRLGMGGISVWKLFIGGFFFIVSFVSVIANIIQAIKN